MVTIPSYAEVARAHNLILRNPNLTLDLRVQLCQEPHTTRAIKRMASVVLLTIPGAVISALESPESVVGLQEAIAGVFIDGLAYGLAIADQQHSRKGE